MQCLPGVEIHFQPQGLHTVIMMNFCSFLLGTVLGGWIFHLCFRPLRQLSLISLKWSHHPSSLEGEVLPYDLKPNSNLECKRRHPGSQVGVSKVTGQVNREFK